jgi:DNA-binding MarR family transcriptional regulator
MSTNTQPKTDLEIGLVDEVKQHCLLTRTRAISRVITSIYDQALRPFGVNASQFSMLVLITGMRGASRAQLGRANRLERSTSTRNLQVLLSEGWVEEVMPEQGRSRPVTISQAGRDLLEAAMPVWREAQSKARRLLGDDGADALLKLAASLPSD